MLLALISYLIVVRCRQVFLADKVFSFDNKERNSPVAVIEGKRTRVILSNGVAHGLRMSEMLFQM